MEGSLSNDKVLEEHIPWETYKATEQLSDRDFATIKRFDKSANTAKGSVLDEDAPAVFEALFSVLRGITHEGTVRYTLALLDEVVTLYPSKIEAMNASPQQQGAPERPQILSRLLSRQDWFTQAKAAKLLSLCLHASKDENTALKTQFLEWLSGQLAQPSYQEESIMVASGALSGLLKTRQIRTEYSRQIPLLVKCLKSSQLEQSPLRSQVLYNLGLCLWQISFDESGMDQLKKSEAVPSLVQLLKEGNKEKVMRISLMTLSRLAATGSEAAQSSMIECGLPRILRIRSAQAWSDEDIPVLLEELDQTLSDSVKVLSSFEKYRTEVLSGALDWTPMHTDAKFWAENITAMEDKDLQIIRCLVKLLETSQDPKVLAVACHDLGTFADLHPHGRFIINDLGGKPSVMKHMASQNPELQKHALVCVQRLMLSKDSLAFLSKPGTGVAASG